MYGARGRTETLESARDATRGADREWCTDDVRSLPVVDSDGWRLVNEGGSVHEREAKLGFLSTRPDPHAPLVFNLSAVLDGVTCGVLVGSLSYLQSWEPQSGAFTAFCSGSCECVGLPGQWGKASDPWPAVDTFDPALIASLSARTRFHVILGLTRSDGFGGAGWTSNFTGDCRLQITHLPTTEASAAKRPAAGATSTPWRSDSTRVRIDGLSFGLASCSAVCHSLLRLRSRMQAAAGRVGHRCALGARRGLQGHYGPSCLQDAPNISAAAHACHLQTKLWGGEARSHSQETQEEHEELQQWWQQQVEEGAFSLR